LTLKDKRPLKGGFLVVLNLFFLILII